MNWTGGSLQRTKTANKGIIQKQKAFFARARAHLQNGFTLPIVPFEPSYLQNHDDYELTGRPPFYGSGLVRHPGHSDHSVRRRYQPIQPVRSPDSHRFHPSEHLMTLSRKSRQSRHVEERQARGNMKQTVSEESGMRVTRTWRHNY